MKFGHFIWYLKRKTFLKNLANWKLVACSFDFAKHYLYWKMKFLKQAAWYVIVKLSKLVQIGLQTSSDSFLQKILWKLKRTPGTSFHATFLIEFFDKKSSFAIFHKLAKFHYRTLLLPSLFSKMCFVFHAQAFETSWHLNVWKVWLLQGKKELLKWNKKKHF